MDVGDLVDGRYRVTQVAGRGGFGIVYRAIDTASARDVALKIFARDDTDFSRFEREAEVLATVRHRHVVAYIGHGLTEQGAPYIAMEWLDGVDLAVRVSRGPLTLAETLTVGLRAAQGLAAVHALAIVHRDVKPSNLFLVGERPDEVRLIDFGIARAQESFAKLTATGTVLGTPAYMAPEQARGAREVTARADVFALGTVLFECLTGAPAFEAPNAHAVLAKILGGAVPRLGERRPDLPPMMDLLLARMLAHDPADRLPDGGAVAAAISGLLSDVTVDAAFAHTLAAPALVSARSTASRCRVRVHAAQGHDVPAAAHAAVTELGGEVHRRGDGVLVASFGHGATGDTVRRGAQLALKLRQLDAALAVAIDAVRSEHVEDREVAPDAVTPGAIVVDAVSARHLALDYEIAQRGPLAVLVGPRSTTAGAHTELLGRARELGALRGAFAAVVEEGCARMELVLGDAGMGKSRLVDELVARIADDAAAPLVLRAQGDRPTSTSPFSIVAHLVRGVVELGLDRPRAELRAAFAARGLSAINTELCCELAGARAADTDVPELAAARRDPLIMADGFRSAWLALLEARLDTSPVVIAVEDLQLVDLSSVRLLDVALEQLADRPLLVVGTAREHEAASVLAVFEGRARGRVTVGPLRPRSARALVRAVTPSLTPPQVDGILERAAGKPLELGELARLAALGVAQPDSLLGAIEARLTRVDAGVRRVLRAASIFGIQFPIGGVVALLGAEGRDGEVTAALAAAQRERFVVARAAFASALVQQAVYDTIPADERQSAHATAGRWLERQSADPSLVAWHFERANERASALRCYTAAARAALEGRDLERAMSLTERALGCGAGGSELARVLVLRAEAAVLRSDVAESKRAAAQAMDAAPAGSDHWIAAAGLLITSAGQLGDNSELAAYAERVRAEPATPASAGARAVCLCRAASQLYAVGRYDVARELTAEAAATCGADLLAGAWVSRLRAGLHLIDDAYEQGIDAYGEAVRLHTAVGDARGACQARILKASFHVFAADFEAGETELDVAQSIARRTGADYFARWANYTRGKILALSVEPTAARAHMERVREQLAGNPRILAGTHIYLGLAALRAHDPLWAEREAQAALAAHAAPNTQAQAFAVLARALLDAGRSTDALAAAERAGAILRSVGRIEENESVVRLAIAQAYRATGDDARAGATIAGAVERLLRIARGFSTAAARETFLQRIDAHALTLRLAHELGIAAALY